MHSPGLSLNILTFCNGNRLSGGVASARVGTNRATLSSFCWSHNLRVLVLNFPSLVFYPGLSPGLSPGILCLFCSPVLFLLQGNSCRSGTGPIFLNFLTFLNFQCKCTKSILLTFLCPGVTQQENQFFCFFSKFWQVKAPFNSYIDCNFV